MCAVIMTIIRQSINNRPDTYAWISRDERWYPSQTHPSAPSSLSVQWSRNVLDDITTLIIDQKKLIDQYIWWIQYGQAQDIIPTTGWEIWSPIPTLSGQKILPLVSEYTAFAQLKKTLSDKRCEYSLPIDNTDPKIAPHIQWWLEHCLITVSSAQKVYPNDILTHEMMRTIADRAWFTVKMNYASTKPVSRDQFLNFFYTLQQHHQIGDLPVVPMSTPLKRSEYIVFLHKVFWDNIQKISSLTWTVWSGIVSVLNPVQSSAPWWSMTVKEFKEMLNVQGKQILITEYDHTVIATPEIMKQILWELWSTPSPSLPSSVWIDKEMMKQTLSRFIEKL